MQHVKSGEFHHVAVEDAVPAKATVALGVSLFIGLSFWVALFLLLFR